MDIRNALVSFDDGWLAKEEANFLSRTFISVDPISGIRYADVYTDDGNGNGNWVLRITLPNVE